MFALKKKTKDTSCKPVFMLCNLSPLAVTPGYQPIPDIVPRLEPTEGF
jgi:hypothetical protein